MKLRDDETEAERAYRYNLLPNQTKKTLPIMAVVILVMIIVFVLLWLTTEEFELKEYGAGDPYHCSDCKNIGFSCKRHRGFDVQDALKNEIERFSWGWTPSCSSFGIDNNKDTSPSLEYIYGTGNNYNPDCDFCKEAHSECYGCSYTRKRFEIMALDITNDPVFKNMLCDKCWKLGYAQCSSCRIMLANKISDRLKAGNSSNDISYIQND